jgi:2-C-methyl-D-erythritol 4-phosphate cytidylyltransferase / 2-C-methyl-D-erythritol 2,4-cyclodiphosphate synthase
MVSAIILAAGNAKRMHAKMNKAYMKLCGKSILYHTLLAFSKCEDIDEVILVCKKEEEELAAEDARIILKIPYKIVPGGEERQHSVYNALKAVHPESKYICVHDGARCLVKPDLIERCLKSAFEYGSGCAGVNITDTLKKIEGDDIVATINRESYIAVQTPQVFTRALLEKAHEQALADGFLGTDESILIERLGEKVKFVASDKDNIKITTAKDLRHAAILLREKRATASRIGHGYDAHRLVADRALVLGGVTIPFEKGLLGHSDADVLIHAVMDSLLGAAGLKDIGAYFPPSDETYKDARSVDLLKSVKKMLDYMGVQIVNIDGTVVLQSPKIAPYIEEMRRNIARALDIDFKRVNVKATTTEGMGFAGRGEGAAAYAVCNLIIE